jgi:type II secretory pathway component PulF
MNYDEFAFFNQQLAAMLREGIPLEGALKQLCVGMRVGRLRAEIEQLGADLSRGTPLKEALSKRALPELYIRMLEIGARSNDLPGVLTLVADYYHHANALWTRLKGLMVYPLIVVLTSLAMTVGISLLFSHFMVNFLDQIPQSTAFPVAMVWMPPLVLTVVVLAGVTAVCIPSWRGWLRWNVPPFKEASLAQLASAMALMLKQGTTLSDALALAEGLEATTPAGKSMVAQWRCLVENGQGKPAQWPGVTRPFPPLFLWLVQKSGEDVAAGFQKAAEIYHARAAYKVELALYGALPVSILFLGQMIIWQIVPLMRSFIWMMNMLGAVGGN